MHPDAQAQRLFMGMQPLQDPSGLHFAHAGNRGPSARTDAIDALDQGQERGRTGALQPRRERWIQPRGQTVTWPRILHHQVFDPAQRLQLMRDDAGAARRPSRPGASVYASVTTLPCAAANSDRLGSVGAAAKRCGSSRMSLVVPGLCSRRAAAANWSRIQVMVRRTVRASLCSPSRRRYRSQLACSSSPWASARMKAKCARSSFRGGGFLTGGTSVPRRRPSAWCARFAAAAIRPPVRARRRRHRDSRSRLARLVTSFAMRECGFC